MTAATVTPLFMPARKFVPKYRFKGRPVNTSKETLSQRVTRLEGQVQVLLDYINDVDDRLQQQEDGK